MTRDESRCGPTRDLLAELIYGELDEATERDVRLHIEDCPACREELAGLERLRAVMRSAPELELPAGLEARIMSEARQALPAAEPARAESEPSGLRALLARLIATPAMKPALAAGLTALLIAGIAWMLSERKGSVIERHVQRETSEPAPSFEAPAAPPEEPVEEERTVAPPPYPTPLDRKAPAATADEPGVAEQPVAVPEHAGAPRAGEEKKDKVDDHLDDVAEGFVGKKAPPPPPKKPMTAKLAELEADEDLGSMAGAAKGSGTSTGAASTGGDLDLALGEPPSGTLGGYAANTEYKPPAEEPATVTKSPPAKEAPSPKPASPAPATTPGPGAAPAPTYMQPAADMEDDEALEAEEMPLLKSAGSTGKKKSWKEKWADYKAKKQAEKQAKKEAKAKKKAKKKGKSAESMPSAAQAPADGTAAQDPFDAAMSKKKDKDYKGCVSILSALKSSPSSTTKSPAKVQHQLASCTAASGDTKKALVLYENLLAKHPSYAGRHQAMMEAADLYAKLGDKKGARALLEKLLEVPKYEKKAKKELEKLK